MPACPRQTRWSWSPAQPSDWAAPGHHALPASDPQPLPTKPALEGSSDLSRPPAAQGGEAGVLSLPPSTGHLAPAGGRAVTHPDTGCWVTATEAPHWRPSRSGGSGGAGLTAGGRCLGSPWHPFSLRQRPVGRLGSVPPQVTCFPARDSPGWGSGQPGLSIHAGQLSTACCSPCQRGAGACPRSHSQLTSE